MENQLKIHVVSNSDLPITPTGNFQSQWRYYSFTILGTELDKRTVLDSKNTKDYIYRGYYAIEYYAAGTDQVQYTFYFDFSVTVERATGAAVDTAFKPLSQKSTANCTTGKTCVITPDTKLNFCQDPPTCNNFNNIPLDLHLNDQFILQQVITTTGLTGYYLTGTEVWYTGGGLNKKANIEKIDNSKPGAVNITLKAEIAWRQVTIKVTSILGNTQTGGRRLLAQTTFDTVTGESNQIECIKAENSDVCASCEQECEINGFAHDGCEECSFSHQIAFMFLALLLVLTF